MSETVEDARNRYLGLTDLAAFWARDCTPDRCAECQFMALLIDAASLSLDLAVAQASEDRVRRSVAWA